MKYAFEIMTDSTSGLPEDIIDKYDLHILSLSFLIEGVQHLGYEKGKTIDYKKYYDMMRKKKDVKTSLPNLQDAYDMLKGILEAGKDVIYLGFSSGLSNTFQTMTMVFNEYKEEYPERKIYIVDTLSATLGQGMLVKYVCEQRAMGKNMEETYDWAISNRLNIVHSFTVDDLFFLKRGGRISGAAAVVGTALSVKPILCVDHEGHLIPLMNVRGRKKSLLALVREMEEKADLTQYKSVFISHGDCIEDAEFVKERVLEKFTDAEIMIGMLDLVIGAHSGPETVALFFYGKNR